MSRSTLPPLPLVIVRAQLENAGLSLKGAANTEVKDPYAENPELSKIQAFF